MLKQASKWSSLLLCSSIFLFLSNLLCVAQEMQEVVYLKNGTIVKGIIIEQIPSKTLKIQTNDGNIFVFNYSDIEKITKEPKQTNEFNQKNSGNNQTTQLGENAFIWHPLGFLQFGPVFQYDFLVGSNFYIGPHIRFSSLGLAYWALNDFDRQLYESAVGVSTKYMIGKGQDKFFLGSLLELGLSEDDIYVTIAANPGYRFRYDNGFLLNTGIVFGVAPLITGDEITPFFMLDLSIGWNINK